MGEFAMKGICRICGEALTDTFVDLGLSPLSNEFVRKEHARLPAVFYPLKAEVCRNCFLVQVAEFEPPEHIFSEYVYFSSFSDSWLKHAEQYVRMMRQRFRLDRKPGIAAGHQKTEELAHDPLVVEVACNDGYLLQYFHNCGIRTLGIEPAGNVAAAAEAKGIPVRIEFFGKELARRLAEEGLKAELLIGNNVLAHVPDLHDFVSGLKVLLSEDGILTMEFPHLLELIRHSQFDTIYHEHFSYLSLYTVDRLFKSHGLTVFDVEKLPTHGGSIRIYACHTDKASARLEKSVTAMLEEEKSEGLQELGTYLAFAGRVAELKRSIWSFLLEQKKAGRTVAAYGAPAKGNTLLNYCGIGREMLEYAVDRSPHKQGLLLPGSLIPVYAPEIIRQRKPDVVIIMPWNLKDEIAQQLSYIREWGGQVAVLLPSIRLWQP
jgi:SAM-dependent methyltransferase